MFKKLPFSAILYQVYLLQLEEYSIPRYINLLKKTGTYPKNETRKNIEWTQKLMMVFAVALFLCVGLCSLFAWFLSQKVSYIPYSFILILIFFFIGFSYSFFIFLISALKLISPLDLYLKNRIISNATAKIKQFPNLKIIGIAGSYGKTTMKELVTTILSQKYAVVKTPKSINTPIGISRVILNDINDKTEYFVVELGEHTKGDIAELCKIAKPDIAVITGINEAHMERMGNIQNTISAIFEVVENMKSDGLVMLNGDDSLIKENYHKFVKKNKLIIYSSDLKMGDLAINNVVFQEDFSGIAFDIKQRGLNLGTFKIAVLGEYILANLIGCIVLAEKLELSIKQIGEGIAQMKPVPHRLQPIYNRHTKVLVIDDSYNGNPQGVDEAIKVLSRFDEHRRIYLTPGLVEAGEKTKEIHYNIGKKLSGIAGLVLLIRNSVTPDIAQGLEENNFPKENIIWFESAKEAHSSLGKILRPYDVILFQNDWPDNYL